MRKKSFAKKIVTVALITVVLTVCAAVTLNTVLKVLYPIKYADIVEKYSLEYDVPQYLIYAVIHTESGFDEKAISHLDAKGLMQITPETFDWLLTKTGEDLTYDDLYEAENAVKYGVLLLSILKSQFSDQNAVIAAYFAGMGIVGKWLDEEKYSSDGIHLENIPYPDTQTYVEKVRRALKIYEHLYKKEGANLI